ncbi:bifunctional hydroxymethylpyrimidine kinase/phosphomethylpyrimidine kinase [Halothiobacillus neapolitanus]|jgi:hydroxymethylpyrimidine/phosphomethylpyrimidine kinase|uniref:hydroxymethylpyrimidine kinase n=1 Tax=Halothiobacillus neapolitanus (strain ATCC 23641 / DSM 15147 / CIP 104769 / NCIMB 8539 / c2) TaxID=555778 RepID=D0L0X1_HALNC|nr:bifunctional hydroxymethylpyrimidine kinase/phosphomethylpyrimidine kinase [Halothiobacillus neapolitanus]ACX96344.1 Phosphomethylpyrimidine kinase [Halothiobacillus neapolitanus c2]OZB74502.1 MAG: hydroxymethylpyrimidine/phosphomethylpyrimidine kinase [Halothiobacillus sp. 14-55-98]OZB80599.1 MAG: hydroxymethylpyrimidine/phosphomethylpyrimidine kinase [Halothiobacillus sp. 13-55-253]TDN66658.1 hydroxymethylpyrimidine/phosphomethylpyrimidine kinase [Halothiobacillus neapolitanus]
MSKSDLSVPVVLVFSGHDPSGGAGVQADIEAIISQGVHPATVITALTVQDTVDVKRFVPTDPSLVIEQARAVLEDMPVQCIKIGMIGSVALVEVIHSILKDYPDIPVVLDPVLIAGGGGALANEDVAKAMINLLLPLTTILTPNAYESRALVKVAHVPANDLDARGQVLLEMGPEYVLLKGGDEQSTEVENWLYTRHQPPRKFTYERLPGEFHGSGCTLASAIAGLIAQATDADYVNAIHEAQEYTSHALFHAAQIGRGQWIPHRLFWADSEDEGEESNATLRIH